MDWGLFAIFLGACGAAAATGSLFPPDRWYAGLVKPRWTPPDRLFPIAWSLLYLTLAVAAAWVAPLGGSGQAMAFWALQIALNALWTPVFFGLQRPRAGLVVILCLWAAVLGTVASFWRVDPLAGGLLLPYLAWVSYAVALNAAIAVRNPAPTAG